jgi:alpha-ketoglutarate-dependent taurine dioxygenase
MTKLSIKPITQAIGAEVTGIDLGGPVDAATAAALNRALADHSLLVIRGQTLSPAQFMAASGIFGRSMPQHYSQFNMPGFPDIGVLSSRDSDRRPDGSYILRGAECWHTDHTNRERPPKATILYAIALPSKGGDTSFASMRAAYAALPAEDQRRFAAMKTVNRLDRHNTARPEDKAKYDVGIVHPLVRTHPDNGSKALYFHPTKTERIVGMEPAESLALIDALLERIIRPDIVYRHRWRVGDMVVCDNRAALHQAHADYDPAEGRLLHRIIVEGDRPA